MVYTLLFYTLQSSHIIFVVICTDGQINLTFLFLILNFVDPNHGSLLRSRRQDHSLMASK